jgi:hypothetical protein
MLTTHLHLLPKLGMSGVVLPLPLYVLMAWTGKTLPFYLYYSCTCLERLGKTMKSHVILATSEIQVSVVATTPNCSVKDTGLCFLFRSDRLKKTPARFAVDVCKRLGLAGRL